MHFVAESLRAGAAVISGAYVLAATTTAAAQDAGKTPPTELAQAPAVEPAAPNWYEGLKLSGSFSLDYRLRTTSGATDQDLYGILAADMGDAATQPVTAHVLARASLDLDGNTDHNGAYAFDSLEDTYSKRTTEQLYEAWLGGALNGPVANWKVGRFFVDDTPVATYVDGARVESAEATSLKVKVGAYGGIPTHLWESSASGDAIYGAFGEARPWKSGRTRFDYMHVTDQQFSDDHHDDLFALSHWQQVGERVDLYGRFTWLEGESRDWSVRGNYSDPSSRLHGQLSYFELLHTQKSFSYEFDPFTQAAFDYEPYRQITLNAGQGFGNHLDVSGGVDVRRLSHSSDEGTFNHDFERFYLVPMVIGLPDEGTNLSLTGELWIATPERWSTVGGEIDHSFSKQVRVSAGTNYALYKYDIYQAQELDRVRTYYAGFDWKAAVRLRLRADYTYESSEFGHFQTVRMRASWTF
jgi:hypothetical protein